MADGVIQVQPDSTGKKLDTEEVTRSSDGAVVERERIVLLRKDDDRAVREPVFESPRLLSALDKVVNRLERIEELLAEPLSLRGEVRRDARQHPGSRVGLRMSQRESLVAALFEGSRAEATRAGKRFWGSNANIGIGPLSNPNQSSGITFGLFNSDPLGGRTIFIDYLGFCLLSGTAAAGATLAVCLSQEALTAVPAKASSAVVQSCSGAKIGSCAVWSTTFTLPMSGTGQGGSATNGWCAIASNLQPAAANLFQGENGTWLDGAFAIPPQHALAIGVFSGAGTSPLYQITGIWSEYEADLVS